MNRKENHSTSFWKVREAGWEEVLEVLSKKSSHLTIAASPPRLQQRWVHLENLPNHASATGRVEMGLDNVSWIFKHKFSTSKFFVFLILFSQCVYIIHACPSNFLEVYLLATPLSSIINYYGLMQIICPSWKNYPPLSKMCVCVTQ